MKEFKITGYVKIGFSKIVECKSYETAIQQANAIELTDDVDECELNDWYELSPTGLMHYLRIGCMKWVNR